MPSETAPIEADGVSRSRTCLLAFSQEFSPVVFFSYAPPVEVPDPLFREVSVSPVVQPVPDPKESEFTYRSFKVVPVVQVPPVDGPAYFSFFKSLKW